MTTTTTTSYAPTVPSSGVGTALAHSGHLAARHLRALARQPAYIAFNLVIPLIYVLLFGALFSQVADIPGFAEMAGVSSGGYLSFLLPGVVMMTAMSGGGWAGMGLLDDHERGITDRLLVLPLWRGAEVTGRLAQIAVVTVIQVLIVVGVGVLRGAELGGGAVGLAVLLATATLVAWTFGGLSCAMGITVRQRESLIGMNQFLVLPLTFLASAYMPRDLLPGWIQTVSRANPLEWAVTGARAALTADPEWGTVLSRLAALAAAALVAAVLATRALRGYQRSA